MEQNFVDIWTGQMRLAPEVIQELLTVLNDEERRKAEKFKLALSRDRFIAVRGLLRQILASYLDVRPRSLEFDVGEHGKPCLVCGSLHFNLSHTGDYLLIAVANFPNIGVDVETLNRRSNFDAMAKRVFSEQELGQWRQLSPDQQLTSFYRLWTKKEAFVKAVGRGIALGMDLCAFDLEEGGQLITIPKEYGEASEWQVMEIEVSSGMSAAIVTKRCDFRLQRKEINVYR